MYEQVLAFLRGELVPGMQEVVYWALIGVVVASVLTAAGIVICAIAGTVRQGRARPIRSTEGYASRGDANLR